MGIITKALPGYSSPVSLIKRQHKDLYRVVMNFYVLNDQLIKINHAFPLLKDFIQTIGHSKYRFMSVMDLRDACHTSCQKHHEIIV